jgi:hypothetical protein
MSFMPWRSARRTTGSPARAASRPNQVPALSALSASRLTSFPVSIIPQVPAFTSSERFFPTCFSQSPCESLSRMRRSAVAASGMRSSASATHMSSTPSCEDRSYSRRKDCMPATAFCCERTFSTSSRARRSTRCAASGARRASSISGGERLGFIAEVAGAHARARRREGLVHAE